MSIRMQQRRGTSTQWTSADPVLGTGELGYETNTGQFKIGDGVSVWSVLPYFKDSTDLLPGQANGLATLNAEGKITITEGSNLIAIIQGGAPQEQDTLKKVYDLLSLAITNNASQVTDAAALDATTKANRAQANAETTASGYVSTHAADTTDIHGITDTANLVYTSALTSGLSGKQNVVANVSSTKIGYLSDVTSAIQAQIDGKSSTSHTHAISSVTSLQTTLDGKLNLTGGTLTGPLTLSGAPTSDLHAATKLYVDGIAAGINFHQPVLAASVGNLTGTYNNGTNGLGATLTAAANGAIGTIDGATVAVGNRILLRAQTDSTQNGIYTITAVGSVSAPWQITRAIDADNNPSGELATGDFCFVTGGSTNASKGFILSTTGTITIGTSNIVYSQFNASEAVTAGTNISKSGSTISVIDAPTFAGLVTATAAGVAFSDGTQTKQGVPSITTINQQAGAYTVALADRDKLVEVNSASGVTISIPTNASVAYPVGTSIDILQTGAGQVTIAAATPGTTTVNATPGLKLRTQWSSATLFKRATDTWVVFGDLTA